MLTLLSGSFLKPTLQSGIRIQIQNQNAKIKSELVNPANWSKIVGGKRAH